ncbi:sulfotransferase [Luteimonas sp. MC1750]|uniref:sulfotransferase family protein n=1 Tax=Luteimonas sp. MC1750 TaxID=2799326 RepID=UPI0018F05E96|nr:sulfotransferase [Luteimonas sp. MC1750]MBJ6984908.1 sulfotransferase [Luteimonas sp. MC1750]QQO05588.1 sulfotransferase [Luteimonas sp. MC1750]
MSSDPGPGDSDPLHADARQRANALAAARDWTGAASAYAALAADAPDDAGAWIGLARASGRAGHYRAMHAAALRAHAARPRGWPHALALARLLRGLHETRALTELSATLGGHADAPPVDDLVALADLLVDEDLHREALAWLDRAVTREPGHAPARYVRGSVRLFLGDMPGAREDLQQAIAAAPHFAHAHRRLSQLRAEDRVGAPVRIARLRKERARVAPGSEHDIHFSHALFDELHDLGEHAQAWPELERGMRAKRATLRYDAGDDLRLVDAIRARCDADFVARAGHVADRDAPAPVFIVGLFRSGSSVLERMLGGHPSVSEGGESMGFAAALRLAADHRAQGLVDTTLLERLDAVDWPALGRDFMAANAWRARGRALWTEKLPTNSLLLGCIARALPRARFIHTTRAPMDVCFSNLRMLYGGFARWSYDQGELAAWHQAHAALMSHWRDVLGPRVLDVRHHELLRDPEATMQRVTGHLGLAFDPAVLKPERSGGAVATASAAQVRSGLRAPRAPDWLPYRDHLGPLAAGLGVTLD